jgi:hypothetical protein
MSGCQAVERISDEGGGEVKQEHVAGPGCSSGQGYNGYMISVEEMKGCRVVQCLAEKDEDWKPEEDDEEFEIESNYFLTGLGEGSPDEAPLDNISPPRHGVSDILINNLSDFMGVCSELNSR